MALSAYIAFLGLIGLERVAELLLSRRNARIAFARGGVESGAARFRGMTLLHALFLPACALEATLRAVWGHHRLALPAAMVSPFLAPPAAMVSPYLVTLVLCAQALRWWAIASLGWRWNVRVIVTPGEPPVRRGPYRFIRHPNYVAVAIEMLCIPLVYGAWISALVFSLLNALVLRLRIRDEERALGDAWERAFAQVPRFIPHG